jgi:hypothetical protein
LLSPTEIISFAESKTGQTDILGVYHYDLNLTKYYELTNKDFSPEQIVTPLNITHKGNNNIGNPLVINEENFIVSYDNQIHNFSLTKNETTPVINIPKESIQFYPISMNAKSQFFFLNLIDNIKTIKYKLEQFSIHNNYAVALDVDRPIIFRDYEIRGNKLWVYQEKELGRISDWLGEKVVKGSGPDRVIATVRVVDLDTMKDDRSLFYLLDEAEYSGFRYFTVSLNQKYFAMLFNNHIQIWKVMPAGYEHYNRIHLRSLSCVNIFFLPNDGLFCQDFSRTEIRYFDIDLGLDGTSLPVYLTYTIIGMSAAFVLIVV